MVYGADLERTEQVLAEAAARVSDQVDGHPPLVLLQGFGSSSVDFEVFVWIQTPWDLQLRASELRKVIWSGLQAADITIAFPQLDVHFDHEVTDQLHRMAQ